MQEFILFEPFLILPKDARSPGVRRPRSGDRRSSPGRPVASPSAPKNRPLCANAAEALLGGGGQGDGGEVLGHSPLKSTHSALAWRWFKAAKATAPDLSIIWGVLPRRME